MPVSNATVTHHRRGVCRSIIRSQTTNELRYGDARVVAYVHHRSLIVGQELRANEAAAHFLNC